MKVALLVGMALLGTSVSVLASDEPLRSAATLDELVDRIPAVAGGYGHGVGEAETALAKEIQKFGPVAVPRMVQLLDSEDDKARFFAGYVLRDLEGVGEEHLDAMIRAHLRGDGWIPPAIARVRSPKAISHLVEYLREHPEADTQVTWALVSAGERVAVPLAQLLTDREPIGRDLQRAMAQVFHEMGSTAAPAVPVLLGVANDAGSNPDNRIRAVGLLGAIGLTAADAVPALKKLAASEPERFMEAVQSAIIGIGTPDAAEVMVALLEADPNELLLRNLAELRENGRGAGRVVVGLLHHHDWDIRVAAARTLGYIGYVDGIEALAACLADEDDWRLVYVAAESLGRLKTSSAVPSLERTAESHWFPAVRANARKALRVIRGEEDYRSRWHRNNFPFEFFEYSHAGLNPELAGDNPQKERPNPKYVEQPDTLSQAELSALDYEVEIVGLGPDGRHVSKRQSPPGCGIRCGDTYLLGGDRGEWGGELVFMDKNEKAEVLLGGNTEGIHRMPFGIVATVGLAHLTLNSGSLYLVEFAPDGKPAARRWRVLPGAPAGSGIVANGNLFVACYGGNVVVTPEGTIRMASEDDYRSADPAPVSP
jgi:HEAT repeat protein